MAQPALFEWQAKEIAPDERSADWFWALAIVALALVILCVLLSDYLLAIVVVIAAVTTSLLAAKKPRIHRFAITTSGITVDTRHYPFDNMLHFSIFEYLDPNKPAAISIKTKSLLAPHLLIPIVGHDPAEIYEFLAFHMPEGKHHESIIDRVVEFMGL